ncbi:MAG: hypothetical protein JRN54_05730 [Nitrososphaerota archaeon]|nr:hypothetical protein [Nitrososphaerota archaeon]
MAEPAILNPAVAKATFIRGIQAFLIGVHEIPPDIQWEVIGTKFPTLKVRVIVAGVPHFMLKLDCTNFDYDPPSLGYVYLDGKPLPWTILRNMVATYPGVIKGVPTHINDVVLFPNGNGFACRTGNMAFHEAHPEMNWRDVRNQNAGRLDFIIDSAIRLLDPQKVIGLRGPA